ncbi:hypothetical protein Y032_0357g3393 [Ancylostoma ceylanicum]|uniref:Uncharacterized protein n=1 Tax=Ancylostoma ceylanicum TaxID=53326 RepID=A0A016RWB4_9BILA|nr:hypothetical protein Y032_0357g3393 [Ancylostoma ceylanicum]
MEPMDVDVAVPSFSSVKLLGLEKLLGHDDVNSIAAADFSTDFARCVTVLCEELKTLYNLQEAVPQLSDAADNLGFLLELSSFLAEIVTTITVAYMRMTMTNRSLCSEGEE